MDLFEYAKSKTLDRESPLASRIRPTTLDEVVGQEHIVGKDKLLYRAIKAERHGRSRKRGTGPSWHVWQKNDSFH